MCVLVIRITVLFSADEGKALSGLLPAEQSFDTVECPKVFVVKNLAASCEASTLQNCRNEASFGASHQ
jgi:hypothetical protein